MSTGPSASSARLSKQPAREDDVPVEEEHKNPTPGSYATRSTRAPRASSGIRTPLVDKAAESTNLVMETRTWLKNVPRALRYLQFVKMYHELQEENGEWEVQQILDARIRNRNLQYKIKWEGGDSDNAWYSAGDILYVPQRVREFYAQYPQKPGPPKRSDAWIKAALGDDDEEELPDHPDDDKSA